MSEPIRVGLVAEGPTDRIVVECALRAMLAERSFVLTQMQPEGSLAFGNLGAGWGGVYRWCKQSARRGDGRLSMDRLLQFDLLVIHVDADVAVLEYTGANIVADNSDAALPCEQPCPPSSGTTNALRQVVLSWCGENSIPERTVLCVPSKSIEAWVVAMLFPNDSAVTGEMPFECWPNPSDRLGQQRKSSRIRKTQRDYQEWASQMEAQWPWISAENGLSEAGRFQTDISNSLGELL